MALVDDSERALFLMPRTTSLAFVLPICVIFTVWFQQLFFDNLFVTHILVDEPRQPLLNSKGLRGSRRTVAPLPENLDPVLIVGSGLAGLTTALHVLDRGGNVVVIEKEHVLGGNSNKAASGINACCPHNHTNGDYLESFENDTIKAAGDAAQLPLIKILVNNSGEAVSWLKERVGVDLSLLAQLGGHSHKRTHRPKNGMVGVEIMYRMQKAVRAYETSDRVRILVDSRVTRLLVDDSGRVTGAEYQLSGKEWLEKMKASNVVLATGGFAADRSSESYLAKYRPELLPMAATTGSFSTGDGIALATAIGAGTIEMNKVQVHPTGWVDPQDPTNTSKILAAEVLRGVGGILIDSKGERFCNELGSRAYVTDRMLWHDPNYAKTKQWNGDNVPTFSLVLSSSAALEAKRHVDLYKSKGLMNRLEGITQLAYWMGVDTMTLQSTLDQYQQDAKHGQDEWGKATFQGMPIKDLEKEVFYVGSVQPVLHYCMGGIAIDTEGSVLDENGDIIQGLHAVGEVTGGVHGDNRLGGNSLLECTVFGTIIGKKLPVQARSDASGSTIILQASIENVKEFGREVTMKELKRHYSPGDCWVAVDGIVYDLTNFADSHPGGANAIHALAGTDGSDVFFSVHSTGLLNAFVDNRIGQLVSTFSNK